MDRRQENFPNKICEPQIPFEMLDLVVDPQGRRLIGNPEHNGEHVLDHF